MKEAGKERNGQPSYCQEAQEAYKVYTGLYQGAVSRKTSMLLLGLPFYDATVKELFS